MKYSKTSEIIKMLEESMEEFGDREIIIYNSAGDELAPNIFTGWSLHEEDKLEFE